MTRQEAAYEALVIPFVTENFCEQEGVFGGVCSIDTVIPVRRGDWNSIAEGEGGSTYAVIMDHGAAYFWVSIKGMR